MHFSPIQDSVVMTLYRSTHIRKAYKVFREELGKVLNGLEPFSRAEFDSEKAAMIAERGMRVLNADVVVQHFSTPLFVSRQ